MFTPRDFQAASDAPVICLGGAATAPADWNWLADYIGGKFAVAAPDLRLDNRATVVDWIGAAETAFLREAAKSGGQINIVAHGAGAIAALRFAARHPGIVRSLVLIEAMVSGGSADLPGFRAMADAFRGFCAEGDAAAATGWHTDYWHGIGAWSRSSAALRQDMACRTGATRRDIDAVLELRLGDQDLAGVVCPVLLVNGTDTTTDAKAVAARLMRSVPFTRSETARDAGHLPHITAPHVTHPMISEFLVRIAQHWHDSAVPVAMAA